jgi:predicted transcriptional regulator
MSTLAKSIAKRRRDKIYIIKDIIRTLSNHGELNQTTLLSYCGLNLTKHKGILENLESQDMIQGENIVGNKRSVRIFKITHKGINFCTSVLEPYEILFPRKHVRESEILFQ